MTPPADRYDPKSDPDLDDDQLHEVESRINDRMVAWVAFYRDSDDLAAIEHALPDVCDRWRLYRAWAFANDKATNGVLAPTEADRLFGGQVAIERFEALGYLAKHPQGWRLVDYLRVNRTRGEIGRVKAARAASGSKGGTASGESRSALKATRDAKQSLHSRDPPGPRGISDDQSTGTGTGTESAPHVQGELSGRTPALKPRRFAELAVALRALQVEGRTDDFRAPCPAHRGEDPNMHVAIGRDRILVTCHSQHCTGRAIAESLGFVEADLFRDGKPRTKPAVGERAARREAIAAAVKAQGWQRFEIRDPTGTLQAVRLRLDFMLDGKQEKELRWNGPNGERGLEGRAAASLPFYGSEALRDPDVRIVVLVEGERKAGDLAPFLPEGFIALGTVTGGGAPHDVAVCATLAARRVILWPDNDRPGLDNMRQLAANLRAAGITNLAFVGPTGRKDSGDDCADFVAHHGGNTRMVLLELLDKAHATPPWSGAPRANAGPHARDNP